MQLKIGDLVVHPAFGMGRIAQLTEKSFSQQEADLFYQVVRSRESMWIRVGAEEATGLRLVTAKNALDHYRDVLKSSPVALNINHRQRQLDLISRLNQGSFQSVCEGMRDLTAWGWHDPLDRADMTTLQKTRDSLSQEWAAAADVSITEAIGEIDFLLLTQRNAPILG